VSVSTIKIEICEGKSCTFFNLLSYNELSTWQDGTGWQMVFKKAEGIVKLMNK
jgi:hypothetical protein